MNRKYNFGAGPAALPLSVLEEIKSEILNWRDLGLSVLEISHRSDEFQQIANEAALDFKDLLNISEEYCVLFLHGGATLQNAMIPLNFSSSEATVSYVNSGYWAKRALNEAQKFTKVEIAASSEESNYSYFPKQEYWEINNTSRYIHITPNETIGGISLRKVDTIEIPLIADYSSSILSEPLDIEKFGMIYGGAQKNIGPAGMGFSVIKKDLLNKAQEITPTMLNYNTYFETFSMYNTPPIFSWYVAGKVFKWLKNLGGLNKISEINNRKSKKIYNFIDNSDFFLNNIQEDSRSIMNIPFQLRDESLNKKFLVESEDCNLIALKGHRSVGGMRASIYNAMPEEGVDSLMDFMDSFERKNS